MNEEIFRSLGLILTDLYIGKEGITLVARVLLNQDRTILLKQANL